MFRLGRRPRMWAGLLVGMIAPVLILAGSVIFHAPSASASSVGSIIIDAPSSYSGPIDTQITLEIRLYPSVSTPYTLAVTTTSPDQGGCSTARALSGVPPVQVAAPMGGEAQFRWPAGLGHGQYWFCASPTTGGGPLASSPSMMPPLTILTDAAPTVQLISPTGRVPAGTAVTIAVSNWVTSDKAPPVRLALLRQGSSTYAVPDLGAQVASGPDDPATGTYTLSATVPSYITAGTYAIVALGQGDVNPQTKARDLYTVSEQSASFMVIAAPTPTVSVPASQSGTESRAGSDPVRGISPLLLGSGAAVVLIILVTLGLVISRRASSV